MNQQVGHFACEPNAEVDVNIVADLDTSQMDKCFVTHIQQCQKSTFNMSIFLVI
jgi:LEA14-like dessication related protein